MKAAICESMIVEADAAILAGGASGEAADTGPLVQHVSEVGPASTLPSLRFVP